MNSAATTRLGSFLRCYGGLLLLSVALGLFYSLYIWMGTEPPMVADVIASYLMPIGFAAWVQADARLRGCTPCFDFGTFVMFAWPITVPWYLIWTRGWRGLLITLMFLGLLLFPFVLATVVWIQLAINPGLSR